MTVRPRSTSTRTRLPSIFRPSAYLYAPKYLLIYKGLIKVQTHSGVLFMTSYIVTSQLSLRWNVSYPNLPDFVSNKQLWLKLFLVDSLFPLTTKSSYVLNTTYTILKPRYPSRKSAEEYRTTVRTYQLYEPCDS